MDRFFPNYCYNQFIRCCEFNRKKKKRLSQISKQLVFNTLTSLKYQQNRHRLKIFFIPTEETLDI